AVSHGIEDSAVRLEKGKAAQGSIVLHLVREGSDVVLTLSDDGAGLDRERIRAKAVERGLLEADAVIEDEDLYQMILQAGFSTASELSQVSGRGVGMDVVLTEVKQLGGTLEIGSRPGQGTSFTIRLPFTLAITDALLVTVGDDIFAIPHSSMDGVVRVPVDELRRIYAGEQEGFHYNDRDYSVRYLGSMLGMHAPHLSEGARWLPLLLVRSGEHRVAIQVDTLMGNRQIVVKSIGAQLSSVRWFTGGTILADGQIALILDVNRLVRMDGVQQPAPVLPTTAAASKGVSVMVVDDSITVRKVTTRLLERHNMHVLTAKDGVDAVTVLQENHPDVMLLDIEMPRMDGYELARHMRSTPELSDIPIIMITSRSGDKHRQRALELGVKRYLGKPYQEADLLENIYTVLADTAL
ncbi:MAG: response regulator, partial [Sedimenticolaceae bacterium]